MSTDIGQMIVDLQRRMQKVEAQSRLKSASLDDAALVVRDGAGSLRAVVGQQGDGTTAVNVVNGAPPPTPSTPTAAPALGGVSAGWDGMFADGAVIPLDWARVEVHASPDTGFTPTADTLVATIETAQGGIVYVPATVPQYVRLLARNTSGAASDPTVQVGPYAPKPVAGEIGIGEITETLIADGAVTTPKVFANAITTALLAAGSVDATALKADAITGKTITGGVINGAEFHSDDGAGGLVDIETGTVVTTAATGWQILIDPSQPLPVVDFLAPGGATAGSINGTGDPSQPGLNISSGPFTDGAITDWRWITRSGADGPGVNGWRTVRVRASDTSVASGGTIQLEPAAAILAVVDSSSPTPSTILQVEPGQFVLDEGRLLIDPPVSSSSAIYLIAKAGQTGYLMRLQLGGADRFTVSPTGAVVAAGAVSAASVAATGAVTAATVTTTGTVAAASVTATGAIAATGALTGDSLTVDTTTFTTYTPTVAGGGSATFTTRTGWYYKLGKMVYFCADITVNAAGSGTGKVTVTAPSGIHRTTRQHVSAALRSVVVNTMGSNGNAVSLTSISGSTWDEIVVSTDSATNRDLILTGAMLLAGATITLEGWYREA